jgi:hypothetical protein
MAGLHVVPDERGNRRVFEDTEPAPLSEHGTATYAEFAALSHARAQGDQEVVVHDRYERTRQPVGNVNPRRAEHRPGGARRCDARVEPELPLGLA